MKLYVRLTLLYIGLGTFWLIVGDRVARAAAADNLGLLNFLHQANAAICVLCSALFLLYIARHASRQQMEQDLEKRAIYEETVQGVYHIVFNYINNMQMVLREAECCDEFNKDTLRLARISSTSTTEELRNLQHVSVISPSHIHSALYANMERRGSLCAQSAA